MKVALFGRGRREEAQRNAAVPPGERVYAVGDVHGRFDLLQQLLEEIEADDRARGPAETHVVMLGDLIDRGPDSAAIVDFFLSRLPSFARFHFVMGNHEEMLLTVLDDPASPGLAHFLRFGGRETFESYRVPQRMLDLYEDHASGDFASYVPDEHRTFLAGFADWVRIGDYLFVHAGVRPDVPLDEQVGADLRWIRGSFLASGADHGAMVVHGHTITAEPEMRANRIGIDTGAFASGVLTALGLEGTERWLLQTGE